MADFLVERLSTDRIPLAYPLIREVAPTLDLQRWTRFARRATDPRREPGRGILVVRRPPRPFPCGLVCYRRDHDLAHGSVLTAEHFVAVDLLDPLSALEALVAELEGMARQLGCHAIRSLLQSTAPEVMSELLAAGHHHGGNHLMKEVFQPPDRRGRVGPAHG